MGRDKSRTAGKRHLISAAMVVVFVLGMGGTAFADAVAVSIDTVRFFSISSPGGAHGIFESLPTPTTTSTTSASFPGFAPVFNSNSCPPNVPPCGPGGLSADPPQATSGPGPFPGENTFTQPPAGGFVGSRADAQILGISDFPPNGRAAANVAESRLNVAGTGGAEATNLFTTNISLNGDPNGTLQFSLNADPYLEAGVTNAGDIAFASLLVRAQLIDGANNVVFDFLPVNLSLNAAIPGPNQVLDPADATFSATSGAIPNGDFTLTLRMVETVRTQVQAPTPAPEAATILLIGSGLAAMGFVRRRRAK